MKCAKSGCGQPQQGNPYSITSLARARHVKARRLGRRAKCPYLRPLTAV